MRHSQFRSIAVKKSRALQVKLAKEKAFELYDSFKQMSPERTKSEIVENIQNQLDEFITNNSVPLSFDGLFDTVMRWLRERENWEKRKLPTLFIVKDDLKKY